MTPMHLLITLLDEREGIVKRFSKDGRDCSQLHSILQGNGPATENGRALNPVESESRGDFLAAGNADRE